MGEVIAPRLQPNGGNIVGVQLDNEIGMLSWVTNAPDFTAPILADFAGWLAGRYDADTLRVRYPFVLDNPQIRDAAIRSPKDEYAGALLRDLGHYMRDRYARYVATLRAYADELGVKAGVLINASRTAVTGAIKGASLFEILVCLGRERVARRLRAAAPLAD